MEIKRDLPVGILFIVVSMFPLYYVFYVAKEFWPFVAIVLCMRLYDLLFDYGFAKIFGYKENQS